MIVFMRYFLFTSFNVSYLPTQTYPVPLAALNARGSHSHSGLFRNELVSLLFVACLDTIQHFTTALGFVALCRLSYLNSIFSLFLVYASFSLSLCRHFLFKTGTGTTPFFGAAAPGYTMATGTVYSTPARPLPRNSLSRGAFKFKKSPKHCSWKCTALIAVGIAVVLSIILCYCIGKKTRLCNLLMLASERETKNK